MRGVRRAIPVGTLGGVCIGATTVAALSALAGARLAEVAQLVLLLLPTWAFLSVWWDALIEDAEVIESSAVGLVLATIITLLFVPLCREFVPGLRPAIVLGVVSGMSMVFVVWKSSPSRRGRLARFFNGGVMGLGVAAALAMLWLIGFWVNTPLDAAGRWRYFVDVPYFEAMAHGLSRFGNGDSPFVVGTETRYHWLVYGWQGLLHEEIGARAFVVQTRILPVISVVGGALASVALARRWSSSSLATFLAPLLVVSSTAFFRFTVGHHLPEVAPSQSVAVAWLLVSALVFFRVLDRTIPTALGFALLVVLGFAVTGAKVTHGAVLLGGAAAVLLVSSVQHVRPGVVGSLALILGIALSSRLLILGGNGNGFGLGLGSSADIPIALAPLLIVLRLFSWGGRWVGLVGLSGQGAPRRFLRTFLVGVGLAGLVGFVFTEQNDGSYTYFALSASVLLSVGSAIGIGELTRSWIRSDYLFASVSIALASVLAFALIRFDGSLAEVIPSVPFGSQRQFLNLITGVVVVTFAIAVSSVLKRVAQMERRARFDLAIVAIVMSSVVTFALFSVARVSDAIVSHPSDLSPVPSAWTADHDAAAAYLREVSSRWDVVATNRLCESLNDEPPECGGIRRARYFWVGALSERRMYVEGYEFALGYGNLPAWLVERVATSLRFASAPSSEDMRVLWSSGVRWVWLDRSRPSASNWEEFGEVRFENEAVRIVRLADPGK